MSRKLESISKEEYLSKQEKLRVRDRRTRQLKRIVDKGIKYITRKINKVSRPDGWKYFDYKYKTNYFYEWDELKPIETAIKESFDYLKVIIIPHYLSDWERNGKVSQWLSVEVEPKREVK